MEIVKQHLGITILKPALIPDNRGWFQVALNIDEIHSLGLSFEQVQQLNHSYTEFKGVVRGPNFQLAPYEQAKIVRCVKGAFWSVAIDIRKDSDNYGKWFGYLLSEENKYLMHIPRGYAHGFVPTIDQTELEYFTDNKYSYEHAKSFAFDDPAVGIDWTMGGKIEVKKGIQSIKNQTAPLLKEF